MELLDLSVNASKSAVNDCVEHALDGLTLPEKLMFDAIPRELLGSILDIGIGAGRTTAPISNIFEEYIGIDISEPSLAHARERFPHLELRCEDARDLTYENAFTCIFFSFNGIDLVNFKDRARIIANLHRALRPGGYLVYSTHSLSHESAERWVKQFFVYEMKWGRGIFPVSIRKLWNRCRLFCRGRIDRESGIGVVNDPALHFGLLMAYVEINSELRRLRDAGFDTVMMVGNKKTAPGFDEKDMWVYLLNRKLDKPVEDVFSSRSAHGY